MRPLLSVPSATLLLAGVSLCATLPVDTAIEIRLTTAVSSNQPSGRPVSAVVTTPVFLNGTPVISAGTDLTGNTAEAKAFVAATADAQEQPATLRLQFTKIHAPGGKAQPIFCMVTDIDNARETVDPTGLVVGIRQSETYGAQLDRGLKKLESKYGGLADILNGVKGKVLKDVDPAIDFPAGVDLQVKLTRALEWTAPASSFTPGPIEPAAELAQVADAEPFRTVAQNPPDPSDMTNLMFLGTEEQIKDAFAKAGWFSAAALSRNSKMETARAIIEDRGYNEAPMSVLNLDGRPPDLALQKQTDTFAKRHHIRIWKRPDQFNGKPIWVAAATHDISITFSQASKSFTHGIDPHIDGERSKVVNDLLFTGAVHNIALVDRPAIPNDASNATGDKLITDGKIAVLEFLMPSQTEPSEAGLSDKPVPPLGETDRRYKYLDPMITAFVVVLVISNLIAPKFTALGPLRISAAQVLFPLTYIFGDVFTEVYGYGASRRAIWYGFFGCFLLVALSYIAVIVPPAPEYKDQAAFETVFKPVGRIVVASLLGYWCGEFANSFTMAKLKLLTRGRMLWTRTIGSTVVGQAVDTTVVMFAAFYGTRPLGIIWNLILSGYIIKVVYETLMTPVTYAVVNWLKRAEGSDAFDYSTNFSPFAVSRSKSLSA